MSGLESDGKVVTGVDMQDCYIFKNHNILKNYNICYTP